LQAAAGAGGPLRVSLERLAASPLGSVSATAAPVLPSALPRAQAAGATGESPAALAAVPPRAAPDVPASFTGLPSVQGSASWDAPARAQQPQTPSTALANIPASAAIASRTDAPSGLSENALEPLRALGLRQLEEIQALRRLEEQRLVGLLPAAPRGGRPVNAR
jgi:hypothetical protein